MSIDPDSSKIWALGALAAIVIAAYMILGYDGAWVVIAMFIFFALPVYGIMRISSLDEDEKWFFSFFIGLGWFSMAVWTVGRVLPLKMAVITTLIIAALLTVLLPRYKDKLSSLPGMKSTKRKEDSPADTSDSNESGSAKDNRTEGAQSQKSDDTEKNGAAHDNPADESDPPKRDS